MRPITASYIITKDGQTAYMEMAATSGLTLVPEAQRNIMKSTTYGVGEMILDARGRNVRNIVMGIGGSATCDAGRGMLEAISEAGVAFSDLPPITVACDVTNPLYGQQGAAHVFAPQKGATAEQVEILDRDLRNFAQKAEESGWATPAMAIEPGAGAAGGLGYGLMVYLNASLKSGIDIILDIYKFDDIVAGADVVITGEGKSDVQTLMGKVPYGVLMRARKANVPIWLLSGAIEDADESLSENFSVVKSINARDSRPMDELMRPEVATRNLTETIWNLLSDRHKKKINCRHDT